MALIEVKRTVRAKQDADGNQFLVTHYAHDTETYGDVKYSTAEVDDPGALNADPATVAGSYCRYTDRVDVYHADARDGTTRLVSVPDAPQCVIEPGSVPTPPDPPTGAEGLDKDPQAPADAVLVVRRCKNAEEGGHTYMDLYYDPATRTVIRLFSPAGFVADTCTTYTVAADSIVGRYCVEPGVAPYIERQVRYSVSATPATDLGTLSYTDVEGVTACQLPVCTLTLSYTATQPAATGLGAVTLLPTGQQGAVVYSLVGSANAPTGSPVFVDLPPGRYTFKAQETRVGGCVAYVTVTLTAAFGVRYRLCYFNRRRQHEEILFRERGYTGPEESLVGAADPVSIDWPGSGMEHVYTTRLRGSELQVTLRVQYKGQLLPVFSGDERLFQVEHRLNDALFWRGYLLPEQYTAAHLPPPYDFRLQATDGLGGLDGLDFTGAAGEELTGDWTLLHIVQHCLARLDLHLPLYVLDNLYPRGASATVCALEQVRFDVRGYQERGQPWSCGKVLQAILAVRQARLYQQDGAWHWERLSDLRTDTLTYFAYAAEGSPLPPVTRDLLKPIGEPDSDLYWITASQLVSMRGAVRRVQVEAVPGELVNLLAAAADFSPDRVEANGRPLGWVGAAPATVLPSGKRDQPGTLLLPGAAPGATVQAVDFLQSPPTQPVPAVGVRPLRLRYTATLRSTEPIPEGLSALDFPTLYSTIRHGELYLGQSNTSQPELRGQHFERLDEAVEVELIGVGRGAPNADILAPLAVRFLQVAAPTGHARYDVEITDLRLEWAEPGAEEAYDDFTEFTSPLLVTRLDTDQQLFHADTPGARLQGTLLTERGYPTAEWMEPALPDQFTTAHAYLVRDRMAWQIAPAQVLTGTLKGELRPGDLLTDPFAPRPGVHVLTSARYLGVLARWEVTAVQLLTLLLQEEELPDGLILSEDGAALLTEDGYYLLVEDAD